VAVLILAAAGCGGGIGPGNGAERPRFQTWVDRRFANVVRQETDFTCGAASLVTLVRALYGRDLTEPSVTDLIRRRYTEEDWAQRQQDGLSMLDLKRAGEALGLSVQGVRLSLDDLRALRGPVIVHLNKGRFQHFSVLRGLRGDRVYLADPLGGNIRMPLFEFAEEWTGSALAVWVDDGRPLPADHALAVSDPIDPPERFVVRRALYSR
jgi:uncharacterized protein